MTEMQKVPHGWAGKQYLPQIYVHYRCTKEIFDRLWTGQDGKCAGCLKEFAHPWDKSDLRMGYKPEVDHDHKTEKIRGLLCRKCNQFLGKIQDNRETLGRLKGYLERNGDW